MVRKGDHNIAAVAIDYFQNLFSSSPATDSSYAEVFHGFQRRITDDMNADLTKAVTLDDIKESVFSVGPSKAPGPDGFTCDFYQ